MAVADSALDPEALAYARGLLKPPVRRESPWPVLGAASLCALAALAFAYAMIVAPPTTSSHLVIDEERVAAAASETAVVQAAPAAAPQLAKP